MNIGLLALQGALEPHANALSRLGVSSIAVRRAADLQSLAGMILPGGESTTMIHLLRVNDLWEPMKQFVTTKPTWGVCAGAILLAKEVSHPAQESLGALSVAIERNGYGRQLDSAIVPLHPTPLGEERFGKSPLEGVFIRAPRFLRLAGQTVSLYERDGEPVMVEEGNVLASAFHPELGFDLRVHEYFLKRCGTLKT